jgi:hypothetical protein
MEHRWGNRVPTDLPVRISCAHLTGNGTLRNLSVSGAFIETSLPLASLAMVRVRIPRDPHDSTAPAIVWGFVARRDSRGIGIEWCELATLQPADLPSLSWHSGSRQRSVESHAVVTIS